MKTVTYTLRLDNSLLDIVSIVPGTILTNKSGTQYEYQEGDPHVVMLTNRKVREIPTNECYVFMDKDEQFPGLISNFREYQVTPSILWNLRKAPGFDDCLFKVDFDSVIYIYPNIVKEKIVFHDKADCEIYCLPTPHTKNEPSLVIDEDTKAFLGKALKSKSRSFMESRPIYVEFPDGSSNYYDVNELTFYAELKDE